MEWKGQILFPTRNEITLIKRLFYNYVMIRKESLRAKHFKILNYQTKPQ